MNYHELPAPIIGGSDWAVDIGSPPRIEVIIGYRCKPGVII